MFNQRSALLVGCADTHPNSCTGLFPPSMMLENGELFQNEVQRWLWRRWLLFWAWVGDLRKDLKPTAVGYVHVGDGSEDNRHSKYGLVSLNTNDIVEIGAAVQEPALRVADWVYVVRGTEAHAGGQCGLEEAVAQRLAARHPGKIVETARGRCSWWQLSLETAGVRTDWQHHAITYSRLPWTRGGGVNRQAAALEHKYRKRWADRPAVALFAHGHYFSDTGTGRDIRVVYLHPWQCTTEFMRRKGAGTDLVEVGGVAVLCRKGEYRLFKKSFEPDPPPVQKIRKGKR